MNKRTATQKQRGATYARGQGRAQVKDLHDKGLTVKQISVLLDMTREGVHYHLRRLREEEAS